MHRRGVFWKFVCQGFVWMKLFFPCQWSLVTLKPLPLPNQDPSLHHISFFCLKSVGKEPLNRRTYFQGHIYVIKSTAPFQHLALDVNHCCEFISLSLRQATAITGNQRPWRISFFFVISYTNCFLFWNECRDFHPTTETGKANASNLVKFAGTESI